MAMMQIYNDLKSIYKDLYLSEYHNGDSFQINEICGNPDVEGVRIRVQSDLTNISNEFLHKATTAYYKDNQGKPEVQHDCDGIMLVHHNNNDYLVIMELKSAYNKDNIEKAEKQIAASLFRMICRLKPLNSFNIHNCKICGMIVSLPVAPETKRDIKKKQNAKKQLKRFEEQAWHFMRSSLPYMLDDNHIRMSNLPVNPIYVKKHIPLFHIDVKKGISEIDIYNRLIKL